MISYVDYSGSQSDVVIRDGVAVPFDDEAAREMAHGAHCLASGATTDQNKSVSVDVAGDDYVLAS